jgi:hypothetical protein
MTRRTFFSFHYQPDIWRVWNVRNSWVINDREQISEGFLDSSVFEASKKESPDALKRLLREGLKNSSVTCVLVSAETSKRRWVRYEIAQSILKGNGLLSVDIHEIRDRSGYPSSKGINPLDQIGLYKTDAGIYLAEISGGKWVKYGDYSLAIPPSNLWFAAPLSNHVVPLSTHCMRYDFVKQNGRRNIGGWIETAARLASR